MTIPPDLTIIIPTRNEEEQLPQVLADLAAQRDVRLELVISDGSSTDETLQEARRLEASLPFPAQLVRGPAGRPGQINRGTALATSTWLMILHADSRLPDPGALRRAMDQLAETAARRTDSRVAGRFRLRFALPRQPPEPGFAYYEAKARLNRSGCIHGDQGLILSTTWFRELSPLPEDLPMLAETRLADQLLTTGEMLLFDAEIITSPRRFLVEGLARRQTLNAVIMNCAAIGWPAFFTSAMPLYQTQSAAQPLALHQLFTAIQSLLQQEPTRERHRIWRATGAYVAANAWQLAFWCDVRHARPAQPTATPCIHWFDRHLAPAVSSPVGQRLATLLTWCWFQIIRRTAPRS